MLLERLELKENALVSRFFMAVIIIMQRPFLVFPLYLIACYMTRYLFFLSFFGFLLTWVNTFIQHEVCIQCGSIVDSMYAFYSKQHVHKIMSVGSVLYVSMHWQIPV